MQLSKQTINDFQEMYFQINLEKISEEKVADEIKRLYESLIQTVVRSVPFSDKAFLENSCISNHLSQSNLRRDE
jgi:uncharacterized protein YggL (DUF469 family)